MTCLFFRIETAIVFLISFHVVFLRTKYYWLLKMLGKYERTDLARYQHLYFVIYNLELIHVVTYV